MKTTDASARGSSSVSRRTIVKGAAWSLPVITATVATPAWAASTACTIPATVQGTGTWLVTGPKDGAAGYVGWRPNSTPGSRRFHYSGGSTLDLSWTFSADPAPSGTIPAGASFRIGVGGENTLDSFWIAQFAPPACSDPRVVYTGQTGPYGNWYIYTVAAEIPASTVLSWSGTVTLKDSIPAAANEAGNFGAYARLAVPADSAPCPPVQASSSTAAEWVSGTPSPLATYAIVSQYGLNTPGYYQ